MKVGESRGFTIIELMVTLGIAGVLAAVAAPSMKDFINNSRLKSHNSALESSLMLARSEAVKRQVRVVVCGSSTQTSCTSGDWQQGWIVFVDTNDSATVDAGEDILEKVPALSGSFLLRGEGSLAEYVSYTKTGAAKLRASDTSQTGVFTLCQPAGGAARQVTVLATGRLSFGKEPVTSCS
jgi:type IV fimbrial biogenesis protein FimT